MSRFPIFWALKMYLDMITQTHQMPQENTLQRQLDPRPTGFSLWGSFGR